VIGAPGLTPSQVFLGTGQVRWFQFDLQAPVSAALGRHLDIDASATTLTGQVPQNDSVMALYDAGGSLVALDDDSGPGFHAQLSFGAGTRPGVLDGRPFAGDNGDLASGRYYLAVGGRPMLAGPLGFEARSTSALTGQIRLDFRTDLPEPCTPDLTGSAIPGAPGYGVPNGVLNNDDFFYFLALFAQASGCTGCPSPPDLTTTAIPGSPGYGVPNGLVNNEDFFYYLQVFVQGC
jgi:hypothetical protein